MPIPEFRNNLFLPDGLASFLFSLCLHKSKKTAPMKVLLLGSGGRECALAWKLKKSPLLTHLWIAPGNAGTAAYGTNVDISNDDFEAILNFAESHEVELIIVGPEAPLAAGIVDFLKSSSLSGKIGIIGPGKRGAMLEASKDFAKEFMNRHYIPTAAHATFNSTNIEAGQDFLKKLSPPYVLKADGLAAGKGVVIFSDLENAATGLNEMLIDRKFGAASEQVIIEEFLHGIELSVFVLTDGNNYVVFPEAKDYKRIGENDTGLNTGGMGAVSPVPFADEAFMKKVKERIIEPGIRGLQKDGIDYCGFLFIGLMNCNGEPYVIEYNVRLGDPETEAILPRIESDLLDVFIKTAEGRLDEVNLKISDQHSVTVMLVSGGYPESFEKNKVISGLQDEKGWIAFHAGTKTGPDGSILSNGGRVVTITATGNSLDEALQLAYNGAESVKFEGAYFRRDIGQDLI
jgi:phosphoribosylamine---glycine ligase